MFTAQTFKNNNGSFLVVFGRQIGTEFAVSHSKPSKTYASEKTAARAVARWEAQNAR